jgi:hypothetical protein
LKGYGWGTFLTSKTTSAEQKRDRLEKDVADLRKHYAGPIFMNWGSDLFVPQDDLVAQLEKFDVPGPTRLVISTPTAFFRQAEKFPAIPVTSGEIPDSWPNIVPSLPHLWPHIIPATATLLAAEKFAAINYALGFADYPPRSELDFLWKRLIESMDHNHDGQGGLPGDRRKRDYMELSILRDGEILRDSLRNLAERVQVPISNSFPVVVEENSAVRAVVRVNVRIADIPITQRLTLPRDLKRLEVENTVEWNTHRFVRVEQLFPLTQPSAVLHYGVPFGACATDNIMPNTGPRAGDEIKPDSWKNSRIVHDWIRADAGDWGLTVATDHQQIRLSEGVIRGEMVRGTRYTSVKIVHGDEVTSMFYPPPGTYTCCYSISSAMGDWKSSKAYRAGMNWNNPLLPITVVDTLARKTLPPTHSFCSVNQDNLVISALKKSDLGPSILLRVYEIEGAPAETPVAFLGRPASFTGVNLLEEDQEQSPQKLLKAPPYAIKTLRIQ